MGLTASMPRLQGLLAVLALIVLLQQQRQRLQRLEEAPATVALQAPAAAGVLALRSHYCMLRHLGPAAWVLLLLLAVLVVC
jgi:hypothetical protein